MKDGLDFAPGGRVQMKGLFSSGQRWPSMETGKLRNECTKNLYTGQGQEERGRPEVGPR